MTPSPRPIRFIHRGQTVELHGVAPDRMLLALLREDLGCTGSKEGCGEGDCGACTVVLAEARNGRLHYGAVNSCIRLAHSIDALALWTVQDLELDPLIEAVDKTRPTAPAQGRLHPAQEAMLRCHGSQCGFCTPGFVMSLFAMYQNHVRQGRAISRALAQQELSGNLCRCTGYRPILDAAQHMAALPAMAVNEAALLQKLEQLARTAAAPQADAAYLAPDNLPALLAARAAQPGAQLVAGCTDLGLAINKRQQSHSRVIDVTRAAELRQIAQHADHIAIGAAVSLSEAFAALLAQWPLLHGFAMRFAGLPVRNAGTLGGNIANASPIGDSMPLLIALRARIVVASLRGERSMALEAFHTGYRQTVIAPDELLLRIEIPRPGPDEILRAYKISKRFDDDISALCLALNLDLGQGVVRRASIGAGGVAATPARACQTEAALTGQPWNQATVRRAAAVLQAEFKPLSDLRASAAYRSALLANLLQRFWLHSQGHENVDLADFDHFAPDAAP